MRWEGGHLLSLVADGQLHDLVAEQVVHVHDLGPPGRDEQAQHSPLLVPDLLLVLEVADDLGLAGQRPHQPGYHHNTPPSVVPTVRGQRCAHMRHPTTILNLSLTPQ